MAETIKCTCCGKELPHTHDYFNWKNKSENKLRTICRECYNAQKRKRHTEIKANDPEKYDSILQQHHDYYQNHKEQSRIQVREWKNNHKRETQDSFNRSRTRRMQEDPVFAFCVKARRAVRLAVMNKGKRENRSSKFVPALTGLQTPELHDYLLGTFKQIYGYEWDGVEPTHVDHIVPLCTESTLEGKQKLFHYTNLRLVKEADNRAKGTSLDYQIGGVVC